MKRKKLIILSFVLMMIISTTFGVYADNPYSKSLISGRADIISEDLSDDIFKDAKEVIIVNQKDMVDAISVTPLAYLKNAPILIGDWMSLPNGTKRVLKKSNIEKITIVGTFSLISATLEQELNELGFTTERISGENRFETSINIANEMKKIKEFSEAFLIDYSLGLENALSIYSYAAENNIPILWSDDLPEVKEKSTLKTTINYLKRNNLDKIYAIGDNQSYVQTISDELDNVENINKINRYDTNIDILKKFYDLDKINKLYAIRVNFGGAVRPEYMSLGIASAKQGIPILICGEKLTRKQDKFLRESNVESLIQVSEKIDDFSIGDIIFSSKFISSIAMIFILIFIAFRAVKYEA